jgi:aryl-alcohol dehydrogenase-like predicted oxidoreductase
VSQTQIAIAWVLAKSLTIVPVIGARTQTQLSESLAALEVDLSSADLTHIEAMISPTAIAGTRYDQHQMKLLDSESQ